TRSSQPGAPGTRNDSRRRPTAGTARRCRRASGRWRSAPGALSYNGLRGFGIEEVHALGIDADPEALAHLREEGGGGAGLEDLADEAQVEDVLGAEGLDDVDLGGEEAELLRAGHGQVLGADAEDQGALCGYAGEALSCRGFQRQGHGLRAEEEAV